MLFSGDPIAGPEVYSLVTLTFKLVKTLVRSSSSHGVSQLISMTLMLFKCTTTLYLYRVGFVLIRSDDNCIATKEEKHCQLRESLQHSRVFLIETEGIIVPDKDDC